LVPRKLLERLGLADGARSLINPMSDELDTMRTSLLPSLLAAARLNQNRNAERVDLFELARVYRGATDDGLAEEPVRLTVIAQAGDAGRDGFLRLKSVMDRLAAEGGGGEVVYERSAPHLYHPGRTAMVKVGGTDLGVVGELHPSTLAPFDLDGRVVALDIDLSSLVATQRERKAVELPRYPAVQRDLAVVVDDGVSSAELHATIRHAGGQLLESVRAFDEYRGGQVGDGRKSIAFTLTFRSPERTLTDAELEGVMSEIRKALEKRHLAGFRS
jgi:phenylalanyl-tRNA synthetase beta chain